MGRSAAPGHRRGAEPRALRGRIRGVASLESIPTPEANFSSTDLTLRLADGRSLGYARYGHPCGPAVFFFHGFPGSRLLGRLLHADAARLGLQVIAPERPGCGLSGVQAGRTLLDWPRDVAQLADALGFARFGVVGFSGGGPYVAACAHEIPDRLSAAAIVSGLGPPGSPADARGMRLSYWAAIQLTRRWPWFTKTPWLVVSRLFRIEGVRFLWRLSPGLPAVDRAVVRDPRASRVLAGELLESSRNGSGGLGVDLRLITSPWGFRLEDIRIPVDVWHGEEDRTVPPAMGRYQAGLIPRGRLIALPGEGHYSMLARRMGEVLEAMRPPPLVSAAPEC